MQKKAIHHIILGLILFVLDFSQDYFLNGKTVFLQNFELKVWPLKLTFYLSCIALYFIMFKIICPFFLPKKRFYSFVIAALLMIPVFAGIRFFLEEIILYNITGTHNYFDASRAFGYYIFDNSFFAFKPILLSTVLYLIYQFIENKKNIHNLQLESAKAEVNFLRSQISPHFLFNTLNTFYSSLILTDPKTAKSLQRLSDLLRYVTYESDKNSVLLEDEIQFIKDYIYFYELRFEDQLNLSFEVIGEAKQKQIPSLILIHFIENLFKHGTVNDKNKPASIMVYISDDTLELITENEILSSNNYSASGIGLKNIETRLKAIYKEDFTLSHVYNDETFRVHLKIPLQNV